MMRATYGKVSNSEPRYAPRNANMIFWREAISFFEQVKNISKKHQDILLKTALVLIAFIAPSVSALASAEVSITEVKFYNVQMTGGVRTLGEPINTSIERNRIGRLYGRFTLIGTQAAIKKLELSGYLSIKVEWAINGRVTDSIEIGISQEKWESGESEFKRQIKERGFFEFRTATYRTYIPMGVYRITVRDSAGNPLSPPGYLGPGIYQPKIEVTKP